MASYEAYLGVGIDASGAQAGAGQYAGATDKVTSAAQKAARANAKFQQQIEQAATALKFFATAVAGLAIREIANYSQEMSNARAMTQATDDEMKQLDKTVRKLGASTSFSASQVAEAAAVLGQAGFKIDEMATALPATLNLAAAATIGMGEAAKITANVMAGFQLETKDLAKAADILAAVSVASTADISGLGEAMKYAGPTATKLGISLEETAAYMAVLAQNGLYAGQAGRNFNSAIFSLLKPSKEAEEVIDDLGLSLKDVNPQFTKFDEIIKKLVDSGIDATQISQIFGAGGFGVITALTSNIPMMEQMVKVTKEATGTTERIAKIKLDNITGDFEQLTGALAELANIAGDTGLTGNIRGLLQQVTAAVTNFGNWWQKILDNSRQAQELADVLNLVKNAIISIMALQVVDWLFAAGNAMRLLNLAMSLNPYVMFAAGLATLALHVVDLQGETDSWTEYTDKQTEALENMGNSGVVAANRVRIAMLEAQRETIGTLVEINSQIDAMNAGAKSREDAQKNMYDPFGAKQKMAGANDSGTFNALIDIQHNRDIGILLKKKAAIEEIESKIAGLNTTVKVYGEISSVSFMKAQKAAERLMGAAGGFIGGAVSGVSNLPTNPDSSGNISSRGSKDKKDPFMLGELKNVQLALELAKNLGAAESELYRIRLNSQALDEAKENKQKGISAITQKQIEQAVALSTEEARLTAIYDARKGLADNLKGRLKTASEALMVAKNMSLSEADLLRIQVEAQAAESARKMGLQGINAEMQFMINKIISLTSLSAEYKKALENDKKTTEYLQGLRDQLAEEQKRADLMKQYKGDIAEVDTLMKIYNETKQKNVTLTKEQTDAAAGLINKEKEVAKETVKTADAAKKAEESQKQWNRELTSAFKDAIMNSKNLGDALSNLANRVQDMLVNKALDSLLGNFMGGFAKGAAFSGGGVTAFASGGVVNSPTMFPMRGGMGLMGEAGAEAIMPLTRTSNGDLGVKAVGGGSTVIAPQITIHVSGGSKEQNDDAGRKVSAAVKQAIDDSVISVILREKRPGGVLNAA